MSDKTELLIVKVEKHPILYDKGRRDFKEAEKKKNAWKLVAIFMRWCMAAHIATVTARITAFCINGGSCELSTGKSRESRNGRVRGRGRALYKQAFIPDNLDQPALSFDINDQTCRSFSELKV